MMSIVPARSPFSLQQALVFMRRFPAFADEAIIADDRVTAALAIGGRGYAFTLREERGKLVLDSDAPLARKVADLVGADDDLAPFYAAAESDRCFAPIVRALYGLHHVRFLGGLAELAVYSVMMQRSPIAQSARFKRKFLDAFGLRVRAGGRTLRAMPELPALAKLDEAEIAEAIGHRTMAARIATVVRGVAALGEDFLRVAPYARARDALLEIPGVGPFSAGAILLRGLGRMDELPSMEMFEREGRKIYGREWKPDAIAKRYADRIGYWSFYLKTAAPRLAELRAS
jgi:DNA-3-methyladenine glycosylase II